MKDALGYYNILQVGYDADFNVIKHSYRDLAKKWHPDYNKDKDTTDIFQKLSIAYEVLGNERNRLIYDVLSLVYNKDNYPDMENMSLFKDGEEAIKLRAVDLKNIRGWLLSYKSYTNMQVSGYKRALRLNAETSILNWLLGWWHIKAFLKNIQAIKFNFSSPISSNDSFRILVHNMVVYANENHNFEAVKCGLQALEFSSDEDKKVLDKFLNSLNTKTSKPKSWNIIWLKLVQLIIPMILLGLLFPTTSNYINLSEAELWGIFSNKKEIDYYQQVKFNDGGESVDDVVVGKIMSIPVDKSDTSKLYHLVKTSKIMYGPSAYFDVIKTLPQSTTVRLTGYTPDNIWARVMLDNGEIGFIYFENIKQGIGKEIPFGSSITE